MNTKPLADKFASFASQPAVLIGLLVLVAALCVATTYQRVTPSVQNQPQKTATVAGELVSTGLSIREIIAMDMFGAASSEVQIVTNHQDIPETNLKLLLKGAFSHSDPEQASALIATDKNKRAELYFIGAKLPGNATLKEVHPNYVVLNRAGRLEKLLFFRNQGLADPDSDAGYTRQPQTTATQTPDSNTGAAVNQSPAPQYSAPQSTTESSFSPASISEIRDRIRNKAEQ